MVNPKEEKELVLLKHDLKMKQLEYERQTASMIHQNNMEHHRITRADQNNFVDKQHHLKMERIQSNTKQDL